MSYRQAWCSLQIKLCDPCLSTIKWFVYHARRYTSALLYYVVVQGGQVIDKVMVVKDRHGAGLYDCHKQSEQQRRHVFKPTLFNSPIKPDKL